jgi:hypothetical protein
MSLGYRLTSLFRIQSTIGPKWTSEKGSTLVEVLVAGLAFGVAVIGIASMMSWARVWTVAQGDTRVAYYLAQDKLEQLLALCPGACTAPDFATVPSSGSACPTTCYRLQEDLTAGAANAQSFRRTTTVDCLDESVFLTSGTIPPPANCPTAFKRITVTVTPVMSQANTPQSLQTVLVSLP